MATDTTAPPLEIDTSDLSDEYDIRSVEVLAIVDHIAAMLEAVNDALANDQPPGTLTQESVDALEEAFHVGERVVEHMDEFLQDPDSLDDDLLADVRRWIVPVGEALGADMTMDAAPGYSVEELRTARGPSFGRSG